MGDHNGNGLSYAVDWGLNAESPLLFAPMAGTATCHPESSGDASAGFGTYIAVHNSVGNVTAIIAHTIQGSGECFPFGAERATDVLQGQFLGVGDHSGNVIPPGPAGDHIHFQVDGGDDETGPLISVPFTLSDHEPGANGVSFGDIATCTTDGVGCAVDGPSDNAGGGYISQAPVELDSMINAQYITAGGASGSWWNVGAPYATGIGPCVFSNSAFAHSCATLYGTVTVQNYIRWDGRISGIARAAAGPAYQVIAPIWYVLGTSFRTNDTMADQLGPPVGAESGGSQAFAGGAVTRISGLSRQQVYLSGQHRATYFFQASGGECDDVNGDVKINFNDSIGILDHFGESEALPPFDPLYDVNRSGTTNLTDATIVNGQFGMTCAP